jgi:xanthine dehydrogenase molybdopterin-binding subunit B
MLFAKLLLSPVPHARIRRIDASAALALPGVLAMITGEDVRKPDAPQAARRSAGTTSQHASRSRDRSEPLYQGEPIVAVAAIDEVTAADAVRNAQGRVRAAAVRRRSDRVAAARRSESRARRQRVDVHAVQEMKIHESRVAELDAGRCR